MRSRGSAGRRHRHRSPLAAEAQIDTEEYLVEVAPDVGERRDKVTIDLVLRKCGHTRPIDHTPQLCVNFHSKPPTLRRHRSIIMIAFDDGGTFATVSNIDAVLLKPIHPVATRKDGDHR